MKPETNYLMDQPHHSEFPLLSLMFSVMGIYTYLISMDMQSIDNTYLLPLAHSITICSGAVAVVLGCISIKEKFFKRKNKTNGKKEN